MTRPYYRIVVLAAVCLACAWLGYHNTRTVAAPPPARSVGLSEQAVQSSSWRADKRPALTPAATQPVADSLERSAGLRLLLEDYLQASRLPPTVQPLTRDMTDVLDDNRQHSSPVPILPADAHAVGAEELPEKAIFHHLLPDAFRYREADTMHLSLHVYQGQQSKRPVAIDIQSVQLAALQLDGEAVAETLVYQGNPSWTQTEEGWHAALSLAGTRLAHGYLQVRVLWQERAAAHTDREPVSATSTAIVHYTGESPARFTGALEDLRVDGSLRVRVGMEIRKTARYHITVLLYDEAGTSPLSYAYFADVLGPSDRHVDIDFYGLIFHDLGASGRFTVKRVDGYVMDDSSLDRGAQLASLHATYQTAWYDAAGFRRDEWTSPTKETVIAGYQQEIAHMERSQPREP